MKSKKTILYLLVVATISLIGCKTKELIMFSIRRGKEPLKYGYAYEENDVMEIIITEKYAFAHEFSEGLGCVQEMEGKYGYINKNDKFVIKPVYDDAYPFFDGMAAVKVNEKWGYINKGGKFIIKPQFDEVNVDVIDKRNFLNNRCRVKINGKWGLINRLGIFVIDPKYNEDEIFEIWKSKN